MACPGYDPKAPAKISQGGSLIPSSRTPAVVAAALVAAGLLVFGLSGGDRALTVAVARGAPRSDASARVAADPAGRDWPHLRGPRHDATSE